MSQEKRTRIKIAELPLRARNLSTDELVNVFGGCRAAGKSCTIYGWCCPGNDCVGDTYYLWGVITSGTCRPMTLMSTATSTGMGTLSN